jgi:hypothetical protein
VENIHVAIASRRSFNAGICDAACQAYMVTCRVAEDPVFLVPAKGYVVSFMAFYERGFSTLSHRFLCSLLQHYGLELHNMSPSGVLHIATFMTLFEAYLGIDPEFDLLNYFFRVRCP